MADVDVKRRVNPANVMALLNHVQQEEDAFMNLDVWDYVVKLQKRGQLKWRHASLSLNRELTGFVVGEVSEDSRIGLLGDRMSSVYPDRRDFQCAVLVEKALPVRADVLHILQTRTPQRRAGDDKGNA
ncbi:hypothetical protein JB92DRAFT_3145204 [Gautieria morchelliformis]|nr:hypothetical protein JB92DRAFT_3145204 [Gautieria morchelliformis]